MKRVLVIGSGIFLAAFAANAQIPVSESKGTAAEPLVSYRESQVMGTDAFLNSHLDLKYLMIGRNQYVKGDYPSAAYNFERAAFYGDKLAQALLAEMYWEGKGVKQDRARGYALADVASERLNDSYLLALREHYWESLNETERKAAIGLADPILGRYSDEHTMKRMKGKLHQGQGNRTSRISGRFQTKMLLATAHGFTEEIQPAEFYAMKFWAPVEYQTFKDRFTAEAIRKGTVKVRLSGKDEAEPTDADESKTVEGD